MSKTLWFFGAWLLLKPPRTPVTQTAVCGELRVPLALHPSGTCKPQILRNTGVQTIEAGASANSVSFLTCGSAELRFTQRRGC